MRAPALALAFLLLPGLASAAAVESSRTLVVSEPPQGNAYFAGADLTVAAAITGDLAAGGGSVVVSSPVSGDALIAGGSVDVRKAVGGDVRAFGGRIMIDDAIGGDLVALGGSVSVKSAPAFAWIGAANVSLAGGARGPVTIYGSSVDLAGAYDGDVDVVATDHLTIEEGTVIRGALRYDAPERIELPASASVAGGVTYTGKSYLPTSAEARTFAVAGATVFFIVRILAALIAAGLIAGLFPRFAQLVADAALSRSFARFVMLALLGFGILAATPILVLLLLVSFAGALVAFVLLSAYVLLVLLAILYAAVIAGSALARGVAKRPALLWRDAVFGMLALSIIALVPILGALALFILVSAAAGTIISLGYQFAFPKDDLGL